MELLIVMGLILVLMGLSIGAFGKLTTTHSLAAAESGVRTLLLHARNTARSEGFPTVVEIDPDPAGQEIRARIINWVGAWHFELEDKASGTGGASFDVRGMRQTYGQVFRADPDEFPIPGKLGDAILFRLGSYLDAGDEPAWNPTDGVILEAYIKADDLSLPPGNGNGPAVDEVEEFMVICKGWLRPGNSYGFSYFLRVTSDYAVEAGIRGPEDSNEDDGIYVVKTHPGAFEPGRWTKVAMTYNGIEIEIRVNGVRRGAFAPRVGGEPLSCPPRMEPRLGRPLFISHPDRSFIGAIDEVRIGAIHAPEGARYQPAGDVVFLTPTDLKGARRVQRIWFDADGRLDPIHHSRPVEILLTDAEGYGVEDMIKKKIARVEASRRKNKKRRKFTREEMRTRTSETARPLPEDQLARITVELSGDIR
ncbi:MAG: hypothetical protein O7H41_01095 [Planctomycetota bacterium]|nr:hypothetical protein [Planctomycetota bacterium]